MAIYTIVRVYQVPADNRIEATDRMLEALTLGVADDFHVKDVLREPNGKPGGGTQISLKPPKGRCSWGTSTRRWQTAPPPACCGSRRRQTTSWDESRRDRWNRQARPS